MALPVLDGNQSATTLSSVVTGGEHIVAHSVVSLGTTAIANITSAVSGVNIGGTVTANINGTPSVTFGAITGSASIIGIPTVTIPQLNRVIQSVATDGVADATLNFVKIGGHQSGSNQTAHIVHVSAGGAMSVDATDSVVSISNFPSTQTIAGTVTANGDYIGVVDTDTSAPPRGIAIGFLDANQSGNFVAVDNDNPDRHFPVKIGGSLPAISGTVTVGNSVTIGSLPAISGTVTANASNFGFEPSEDLSVSGKKGIVVGYEDDGSGEYRRVRDNQPLPVTINPAGAIPTFLGTVTVGNNNFNIKTVIAQDGSANFTAFNGTQFRLYTPTGASKTLNNIFGAIPSWVVAFSDSVTWLSDSGTQVAYFHDGTQWTLDDFTTPAGTLALDGSVFITNLSSESSINLLNGFTAAQLGSAFVNGSGALRVNLYSSTVTAAAPNGSLTTRFGTPTTANTAFATAAVTKSDRKYLLIQNVTTGSNVITVGIGFTPTTTQGIQLTAGAGITFESSYIPTGAVQILSSVTASNFTILEA